MKKIYIRNLHSVLSFSLTLSGVSSQQIFFCFFHSSWNGLSTRSEEPKLSRYFRQRGFNIGIGYTGLKGQTDNTEITRD